MDITHVACKPGGYVFISTMDNGVFRSDDNGSTWKAIGDFGINGPRSMAVGPEGNVYAGVEFGFFRSTDNGNTWTLISGVGANCMAVDQKTGYIYTGGNDGAYRSKDRGLSFQKVHNDPTGTFSLAVDTSGRVYAGGNGVYVSFNHGDSWLAMNKWTDHLSVSAMAVSEKGILYFGDVQGGLYKSSDQANSFLPLSNEMSITYVPTIAVNSEGTVYIGSLDRGIVRSTDNGASWQFINNGLTNPEIQTLSVAPDGGLYAGSRNGCLYHSTDKGNTWKQIQLGTANTPIHTWKQIQLGTANTPIHTLMTDSSGNIFAFSKNSGVFRTSDKGASWYECVRGFYRPGYYSAAINKKGELFLSGGNGFYMSTDHGENWVCMYNAKDYSPMNYLQAHTNGEIFGVTQSNDLIKSTDNGTHWTLVSKDFNSTYLNNLLIAPNGHIFLAVSLPKGLFRSTDLGVTWEQKHKGLNGMTDPEAFGAFTIDSKGQLFAAFTGDQGIYRSTDDGETWTRSMSGPPNTSFDAMASDGKDQLIAASSQHVYRSIDNGDNWKEIFEPEMNLYIYSIIFYPNGEAFYGTGRGVYRGVDSLYSAVEGKAGSMPAEYSLAQNYPNPFNPTTTINYSIANPGFVSLKVYDILGHEVSTLVNGMQSKGTHSVKFDGSGLASGVYMYRLQAEKFVETKKLLLFK
ncbi:MAG: T9SS type A sorting domain-containing protein [Ignavibacteriales bacterium]